MNPRKQAVPHIAAQVLSPQPYHLQAIRLARIGKERDHRFRKKLHQQDDNRAKPGRNKDCITQRGTGPLRLPRANILCAQCR